MKILDRYLAKGFLSAALYCTVLFLVLFVVIDAFNNLDEFLKKGVSVGIVLTYYLYMIPSIFVQIAPVAALVSILYTLGSHNRHNEIIAMKASGVSSFHILAPYFFVGILFSFFILLINETIVPQSSVTSTSIMEGLIQKGKKNLQERSIRNVTMRTRDNTIVFAREFEMLTQTLYDVVIIEDNPALSVQSKIIATKSRYGQNGVWILTDAMKYQMNRRHDLVGDPVYSQRTEIKLDKTPDDFIREASQSGYMNSRQLKEYLRHLEGVSHKLIQKLSVELHYKIAFPFTIFIVMLIGAPLAMKTQRGSALAGIGTSAILVLLYYGLESICLALGKGGYLPPLFAAWFSNLLFGLVGIYLIKITP